MSPRSRLKGTSGATTRYELKETEAHSGVFKGVFTVSYADREHPRRTAAGRTQRLPGPLRRRHHRRLRGPVAHASTVNKGADGIIEPFSKRFTGDEMAVRTSFTLAECYFELAKKHREMEQESLARREIGQARKLLAEALATHRDDELKAHAEYLLGNLAQEYADLAKNEEAKLPMYQDALARFSKIPSDYPETEFASKAQFKTALVYEKMGEIENSVEEYVKLAYKYPDDELIPTVMSRLGGYFQKKGLAFKKQADPLREKEDDESKAEVLRLDELSYPEFLNAAMVFSKLAGTLPRRPARRPRRTARGPELHARPPVRQGDRAVPARHRQRELRRPRHPRPGHLLERPQPRALRGHHVRGQLQGPRARRCRRPTSSTAASPSTSPTASGPSTPAAASPTRSSQEIIERETKERERMIEALKESRRESAYAEP